MRPSAFLLIAVIIPGAATANTFTADGEASTPIVMQDEKGPHSCGHRTMMVVDHANGTATTADLQLISSWSDEKSTFYGMMKLRVARNRLLQGGASYEEIEVGEISRFSVSTNDFSATAAPYQSVSASNDPGYYLTATEPVGINTVVMPDDDGTFVRILSFLDAKKGFQENIRFKVNLEKEDALTFIGCVRAMLERAKSAIGSSADAPAHPAQSP